MGRDRKRKRGRVKGRKREREVKRKGKRNVKGRETERKGKGKGERKRNGGKEKGKEKRKKKEKGMEKGKGKGKKKKDRNRKGKEKRKWKRKREGKRKVKERKFKKSWTYERTHARSHGRTDTQMILYSVQCMHSIALDGQKLHRRSYQFQFKKVIFAQRKTFSLDKLDEYWSTVVIASFMTGRRALCGISVETDCARSLGLLCGNILTTNAKRKKAKFIPYRRNKVHFSFHSFNKLIYLNYLIQMSCVPSNFFRTILTQI